MPVLTKILHVSELPAQLREGRDVGFVTVTVEDALNPSEPEKLQILREALAEGDRDLAEGRFSPAEDVFARLRAARQR
jgi:hypothetical protein